ncbi:MAG: zinc ribbon domain-containing protein [Halapricum sp.]
MAQRQKRPWLAAVLSLLYPGVGHVYLREWFRAMLWFGLVFAASFVLVPDGAVPETLSVSAMLEASRAIPLYNTLALLSLTVFSMIDAYTLAKRRSVELTRPDDTPVRKCPSCGHTLDDDDLDFCPWCAEPLADDS